MCGWVWDCRKCLLLFFLTCTHARTHTHTHTLPLSPGLERTRETLVTEQEVIRGDVQRLSLQLEELNKLVQVHIARNTACLDSGSLQKRWFPYTHTNIFNLSSSIYSSMEWLKLLNNCRLFLVQKLFLVRVLFYTFWPNYLMPDNFITGIKIHILQLTLYLRGR